MELQTVGHNWATIIFTMLNLRLLIYKFDACFQIMIYWSENQSLQLIQFHHSVMSDCLWLHGLQQARLTFPSPTPRIYSNSCPLSQWCHPTISFSIIPFSSSLHFFPASAYFPMSQFFTLGGQSIRVFASASVIPMNIQDWFPLGSTGWVSLKFIRLSKVCSKTSLHKH